MQDEMNQETREMHHRHDHYDRGYRGYGGGGGAVYGLGFIGACVYFIGTAPTFWLGVLGFLKAIVWPALLVFAALKSLGL